MLNVMGNKSSYSVSIDIDLIPLGGKECTVKTSEGSVFVLVCGDQDKPALITYPDVALNYVSCFQGLLFCPEAASLLLHNFCIYHIDAPGHEVSHYWGEQKETLIPIHHILLQYCVDCFECEVEPINRTSKIAEVAGYRLFPNVHLEQPNQPN